MAADGQSVTESEDVDETLDTTTVSKSFTLEVLQIIKEAQQQHGLRHGDFQRYRQYCARRIRRIRKSLHFAQGTKHRVTPKKITPEILKDARYLYLPLMDAERAWASAMQLKSEANTEVRKRFHMRSRLKKAVQHTDVLVTLCESDKCDARTKLEAQAYANWMKASLSFELENWKTAMELFNNAKTIYEKLAGAFAEEIQAVYLQKVEEISPNMRYCAYNIGDQSAINDLVQMRAKSGKGDMLTSKLDELISQTREKQAATLSELTWRGRTLPVKNEQVRVFLLNVQENENELAEATDIDSKVSILESLLKDCIDAQQVLRDELKNDPNYKLAQRGQKIEGKVSNVQFLLTHLMYIRLTKTIERNILMIESLKRYLPGACVEEGRKITKPQDLARLYDIIIQNLSEIPNLPGLEEDSSINEETSTEILGYKAFRCYYTAETYASAKKWQEAIALYDRTLTYARDAVEGLKNTKTHSASNVEISHLEDLIKESDGLKYSCHASSILDVESITGQVAAMSIKNNVPLADRLEEYFEDGTLVGKKPNLTKFPPEFQPIPAKPLFFDLALNHVEFPSLDDKLEQKKQGGITEFVKGWLWGSKN